MSNVVRSACRPPRLSGDEATILSLIADSPSDYRMAALDDAFGVVRREVRGIAAILTGEETFLEDLSEAELDAFAEAAEHFRKGALAAKAAQRPYRW